MFRIPKHIWSGKVKGYEILIAPGAFAGAATVATNYNILIHFIIFIYIPSESESLKVFADTFQSTCVPTRTLKTNVEGALRPRDACSITFIDSNKSKVEQPPAKQFIIYINLSYSVWSILVNPLSHPNNIAWNSLKQVEFTSIHGISTSPPWVAMANRTTSLPCHAARCDGPPEFFELTKDLQGVEMSEISRI